MPSNSSIQITCATGSASANSHIPALAKPVAHRVLANAATTTLAILTLGFCSCQSKQSTIKATDPFAQSKAVQEDIVQYYGPENEFKLEREAAIAKQLNAHQKNQQQKQQRRRQQETRPPAEPVEVPDEDPKNQPEESQQIRGQSPTDGPIFQPHCPAPAIPTSPYGMPHQFPQLPATGINHPPVEQDAPWRPPGITGEWPRDEYIHDGGDHSVSVKVDEKDFTVGGLEMQDTVGHFDTLDGRTLVEPSNTVSIYAPRFAAVRQVYGFAFHEAHQKSTGVDVRNRLAQENDLQIATTALQREQLERRLGTERLSTYRERQKGLGIRNRQNVIEFSDKFLPYEDFQIIRLGQFEASEKARLAQAIDAALYWDSAQAVQVTVNEVEVAVETGSSKPQETKRYKRPDGTPQMRVVKVASAKEAKPGDIIDFTIRFDNTGTEKIGNVTILDNLTTRLEYVEDSAECDLDARFLTIENEGESVILRWEITNPLDVGEGGIVRFKCRVR